ncbi:MAG: hypothetical protein GC168_21605 [Candidatus Hydrogenedens sp.]|nr:hypothetical protein [Candidatus Hydrogenedens sp.]
MKTIYVVTMWSGGKPARKWQTEEAPEVLEHGSGVRFVSRESRLSVCIIGPISIEEYESGKEEIETGLNDRPLDFGEDRPRDGGPLPR